MSFITSSYQSPCNHDIDAKQEKKKEEKERISLIDPTHSILLTLKVMIVFILTICVSLFSFFDHLYLILLSYCHIEIAIYFRNLSGEACFYIGDVTKLDITYLALNIQATNKKKQHS